jgi:hypothetical protein
VWAAWPQKALHSKIGKISNLKSLLYFRFQLDLSVVLTILKGCIGVTLRKFYGWYFEEYNIFKSAVIAECAYVYWRLQEKYSWIFR